MYFYVFTVVISSSPWKLNWWQTVTDQWNDGIASQAF